ncbi:MAG TPA: hypothetical protein VMK65_01750, partial [Longimicrobiales bacterium]|nr:hypothetical protein [Longimicrobiales bacterium]
MRASTRLLGIARRLPVRPVIGLAALCALVPAGLGAQASLTVESAGARVEVPAQPDLPFVGYPARAL